MGCVQSKEEDEVLQLCKERRRLMKELLGLRDELATTHMMYLQSLRNIGATLRQFTDVDTMTAGSSPPVGLTLPPSPPPLPSLPPSPLILPPPPPPPPPPVFSPISTKESTDEERLSLEDGSSDLDNDESCLPPPPMIGSSWHFWNSFDPPASLGTSSPVRRRDKGTASLYPNADKVQEDWPATISDSEEDREVVEADKVVKRKVEAFNGGESLSVHQMRERFLAMEAENGMKGKEGALNGGDGLGVHQMRKRHLVMEAEKVVKGKEEAFNDCDSLSVHQMRKRHLAMEAEKMVDRKEEAFSGDESSSPHQMRKRYFTIEAEKVAKGKEEAFSCGEGLTVHQMRKRYLDNDLADDNLSAMSGFAKDIDIDMAVWRSKRTLSQIVKQLDEYFLTAAAGGNGVAALLESNKTPLNPWEYEARKGRSSKSAKVGNVFSWNWSFKSPHSNKDVRDPNHPRMPVNHSITLEKIYADEQNLYKEIKDEEIVRSQHKKIMLLLHKIETGDYDFTKNERTQSNIEDLQCRMVSLHESIGMTSSSILKLRDEELFPQLVELCFSLVEMWRTMYDCHQAQNHASQKVSLLDNYPCSEPTTDSHHLATAQLENEMSSWYTTFCMLIRLQREYAHTLNQWVRLTDQLPRSNGPMSSLSGLSEQLVRALDGLPDKVAAEAIKNLSLVIRSIVAQQTEELSLQKKSDRLESRLVSSLSELEKYNESAIQNPHLLPELAAKHAKVEAFKKRVEEERAKYLDSVRMTQAMTLRYLQMSLPNVFQALTGFAGAFLLALEGIAGFME